MLEAVQGAARGAGVEPAGDHQHGDARGFDLLAPAHRRDVREAVRPQRLVAEVGGGDRGKNVGIGCVLAHGRGPQTAVGVGVDPAHQTAARRVVGVEQSDEARPLLDEARGHQAVGPGRAAERVEVGPARDDRLHRRMAGRREQLGSGPGVRRAIGPDLATRPAPADHPFDDVVAVADLLGSVLDGAGAERRARAAHVDLDQGVAMVEKSEVEIAPQGHRLAGLRMLEAAPVAGQLQERRQAGVRVAVGGQVDVDSDPGAVLHRHVGRGPVVGRLGENAGAEEQQAQEQADQGCQALVH